MSKTDVVRDFLNRGIDLDHAANVFADDFQWVNSTGQAFGKEAYLGLGANMLAAFPDLRYVVEDIHEADDGVIARGHWEGTFENDFDMSAMGIGVIPPNGEAIVWPTNTARWGVEGDQITSITDTSTGPDAGMPGFLRALGVNVDDQA